jgi:hypothetical protein
MLGSAFGWLASHVFLDNFDALYDDIFKNSLSLNEVCLIALKLCDCFYIRLIKSLHLTGESSLSVAVVSNGCCGLDALKVINSLHFVLKTARTHAQLLSDTCSCLVHLEVIVDGAPSCRIDKSWLLVLIYIDTLASRTRRIAVGVARKHSSCSTTVPRLFNRKTLRITYIAIKDAKGRTMLVSNSRPEVLLSLLNHILKLVAQLVTPIDW